MEFINEGGLKKMMTAEQEFVGLTNYMFDFDKCISLIHPNEDDIMVKEESLPIEEVIRLIKEEGYSPIPF